MIRFYNFPKWLKGIYPGAIWDFFLESSANEKVIYLTFDDGPTPEVTDWILMELDKVNALATFFCIGQNVEEHPDLFESYLKKGHMVGNHTMNHLKGHKTDSIKYVENVLKAQKHIDSTLFRPPYGRCTPKQHKKLKLLGFKTIFWSHLTYDFDKTVSSSKRIRKIKQNLKSGSVLVFHDSVKAYSQLKTDLPIILNHLKKENYEFRVIKA